MYLFWGECYHNYMSTKTTLCNLLILNLTLGLWSSPNYSRLQWSQDGYKDPTTVTWSSRKPHHSKGGRNSSGTRSKTVMSEYYSSLTCEDLQTSEHVSLNFQSLYLNFHVKSPLTASLSQCFLLLLTSCVPALFDT